MINVLMTKILIIFIMRNTVVIIMSLLCYYDY